MTLLKKISDDLIQEMDNVISNKDCSDYDISVYQKAISYQQVFIHSDSLTDLFLSRITCFYIFHCARLTPNNFKLIAKEIDNKNIQSSDIFTYMLFCAGFFKHEDILDYIFEEYGYYNYSSIDITLVSILAMAGDLEYFKKYYPKLSKSINVNQYRASSSKYLLQLISPFTNYYYMSIADIIFAKTNHSNQLFNYIHSIEDISSWINPGTIDDVISHQPNYFKTLYNLGQIDFNKIKPRNLVSMATHDDLQDIFLIEINKKINDVDFISHTFYDLLRSKKTKKWALDFYLNNKPLFIQTIENQKNTWKLLSFSSPYIFDVVELAIIEKPSAIQYFLETYAQSVAKNKKLFKVKEYDKALEAYTINGGNKDDFLNHLHHFTRKNKQFNPNSIFEYILDSGNLRMCDWILKNYKIKNHKSLFIKAFSSKHKFAVEYLISRGFKPNIEKNHTSYFQSLYNKRFHNDFSCFLRKYNIFLKSYHKEIATTLPPSSMGGSYGVFKKQQYNKSYDFTYNLLNEVYHRSIPKTPIKKTKIFNGYSVWSLFNKSKRSGFYTICSTYTDTPFICNYLCSQFIKLHNENAINELISIYSKNNSFGVFMAITDYLENYINKNGRTDLVKKLSKNLFFSCVLKFNHQQINYLIAKNIITNDTIQSLFKNDTALSINVNYLKYLEDRWQDFNTEEEISFEEDYHRHLIVMTSKGLNINKTNSKKQNVLFNTAQSQYLNKISNDLMKNFGASAELIDKEGKTVIDIALQHENLTLVAQLEAEILNIQNPMTTVLKNSVTNNNRI